MASCKTNSRDEVVSLPEGLRGVRFIGLENVLKGDGGEEGEMKRSCESGGCETGKEVGETATR